MQTLPLEHFLLELTCVHSIVIINNSNLVSPVSDLLSQDCLNKMATLSKRVGYPFPNSSLFSQTVDREYFMPISWQTEEEDSGSSVS